MFSDYYSSAHCVKHVGEHFHIPNNLNKKKRLLTFWCSLFQDGSRNTI